MDGLYVGRNVFCKIHGLEHSGDSLFLRQVLTFLRCGEFRASLYFLSKEGSASASASASGRSSDIIQQLYLSLSHFTCTVL